MEHNRYCGTTGEDYENSKSADFPLKVNDDWPKSYSWSNQHNRVIFLDQIKKRKLPNFP